MYAEVRVGLRTTWPDVSHDRDTTSRTARAYPNAIVVPLLQLRTTQATKGVRLGDV